MTATMTPATDKQLSFINTLRKERYPEATTDALLAMRAADATLTKQAASKLIESLLAMPKPAVAATEGAATAEVPATDKQIAFLKKLATSRVALDDKGQDDDGKSIAEVLGDDTLADLLAAITKQQASKTINKWLTNPHVAKKITPEEAAAAPAPVDYTPNPYVKVAEKGDVHYVDGAYYRIHMTQYSKKPYAAKAVILSKAVWNDEGTKILKAGRVQWITAKGKIHELSEATKVTPEEAAAFGKMIGRCCYCSLKIDTPESVSAGYGPICASNKGLPWGAVTVAC